MIAYFDTSALVPLLIDEPASARCRELYASAEPRLTSMLSLVEVTAAITQAHRLGRVDDDRLSPALAGLDELWEQLLIVGVDEPLCRRAAALSRQFGLRGYDAVHCASADLMRSEDLVACAGGRALLVAWQAMGLAVRDVVGDVP